MMIMPIITNPRHLAAARVRYQEYLGRVATSRTVTRALLRSLLPLYRCDPCLSLKCILLRAPEDGLAKQVVAIYYPDVHFAGY
jgi:hypothetical protein